MKRDVEYETAFVVMEAAQLAFEVGIDELIEQIRQEYEMLCESLADPRSYGPDRD